MDTLASMEALLRLEQRTKRTTRNTIERRGSRRSMAQKYDQSGYFTQALRQPATNGPGGLSRAIFEDYAPTESNKYGRGAPVIKNTPEAFEAHRELSVGTNVGDISRRFRTDTNATQ